MSLSTIDNPQVQMKFDQYPKATRAKLMMLRQLILDVASQTEEIGSIEETLKWGQISYLTQKPKSGTTIRIDAYNPASEEVALFVHCQTSLVDSFKFMYPDTFAYEGNRAVIFENLSGNQINVLKHLIELALTYHQRK